MACFLLLRQLLILQSLATSGNVGWLIDLDIPLVATKLWGSRRGSSWTTVGFIRFSTQFGSKPVCVFVENFSYTGNQGMKQMSSFMYKNWGASLPRATVSMTNRSIALKGGGEARVVAMTKWFFLFRLVSVETPKRFQMDTPKIPMVWKKVNFADIWAIFA